MYGIVALVLFGAGLFVKEDIYLVASGLFAIADAGVSISGRLKKL